MTIDDLQLSQYTIVRRLGSGGMAEVFLADKIGAAGFSRPVAIKTILAGNAPKESIALFLDEARVASFLQHSGIVQTLDLGFENATLFIAMEYIAGPTLSRLVYDLKRMGGLLPWPIVAYVGARVANALDYAHRRATDANGDLLNLVHRDVSPQNILVTRNGIVKLTDFGVARASIQMHKTKTGQVRGKAAYMAPEQVRAKEMDGRTDMFALGIVLYEALTGHRPFQRKTDIQSMRSVLGDIPPPIEKRNPSAPKSLINIVNRCLEKDPDYRFQHCGELEAKLQRAHTNIRDCDITDKISEIMNDVFGVQSWDLQDDRESVESWHPTLHINEHGEVKRPQLKRLDDPAISEEIADMLNQTPRRSKIGQRKSVPKTPNHALVVHRVESDRGLKEKALLSSPQVALSSSSPQAIQRSDPSNPPVISTFSSRRTRFIVLIGLACFVVAFVAFYVFRSPTRFGQVTSVRKSSNLKKTKGLTAVPGKNRKNTNLKSKTLFPKTMAPPQAPKTKPRGPTPRNNTQKKSNKPIIKKKTELVPQPIGVTLSSVLDLIDRSEQKSNNKLTQELESLLLKLTEDQPLNAKDRMLFQKAHNQLQ